MQKPDSSNIQFLSLMWDTMPDWIVTKPITESRIDSRRSYLTMEKKDGKSNSSVRQDDRVPQFSELSMIYEGCTENIAARSPDLSPHGMFVSTAKEFPEGAILKLRFRLSRSGIMVKTRCEVRYCLKDVGLGVEFLEISPEFVQAIENEIEVATQHV
jgi:hypothetical protein